MIRERQTTNDKCEYIRKSGHYYWRELPSGRIIVSDESADQLSGRVGSPWETEDGIMYLDGARLREFPDIAVWASILPQHGYIIPLVLPSGDRSATPAGIKEFLFAVSLAKGLS